jgi:hypothetical protein
MQGFAQDAIDRLQVVAQHLLQQRNGHVVAAIGLDAGGA